MNSLSFAKKSLLVTLIVLLFSACGYRPSSQYAKVIVGEKISTSVKISAYDPENTVLIKDSVDSAILQVFGASLVPKQHSQTHLKLTLVSTTYTPTQYDSDGFVIAYRSLIRLNITRITKKTVKNYVSYGSYDFSVAANAVLTDQQRFDAIKFSSDKAIRSFLAQVSAEGARQTK